MTFKVESDSSFISPSRRRSAHGGWALGLVDGWHHLDAVGKVTVVAGIKGLVHHSLLLVRDDHDGGMTYFFRRLINFLPLLTQASLDVLDRSWRPLRCGNAFRAGSQPF